MAFFSPGFILGAATRATEKIDDARERNEELAEEIQKLTKEHSRIAARAISARAVQDSEFVSKAKLILGSSKEGEQILKNVGDNKQTLVAIGREATKRMEVEKNLTPTMFNKALLSKSITPEGKFQNPYNLVQADLTTNPSEEAKQTEKLGFGQRLLEGLVGKKPTIEEAVAGMTPEMRAATLESIRTGQPLAARDPVQFAAGQIEVPVLSAAEMERMRLAEERYKKRLEEQRKYNEGVKKEERDYRKNLKEEERDRLDNSRLRNPAFERLLASELEIEQAAITRDASDPNLSDDQKEARRKRVVAVAALSRQLYAGGYYTHGRVVTQNENLFDTSKAIYDLLEGDNKIVSLSSSEIKQLNEMGLKEYLEYRKRGGQPDQIVRPEDEEKAEVIDDSDKTDELEQGASADSEPTVQSQLEARAAELKRQIAAEPPAREGFQTTTQRELQKTQEQLEKLKPEREKILAQVIQIDQQLNRLKSAKTVTKSVKDTIRSLEKRKQALLKRIQKTQEPTPVTQSVQKPKVKGSLLDAYRS